MRVGPLLVAWCHAGGWLWTPPTLGSRRVSVGYLSADLDARDGAMDVWVGPWWITLWWLPA